MLPLPDKEWYSAHPKAVNTMGNLDIAAFQQGLRISPADHESLATELIADLKQNGIAVGDLELNFRSQEMKNKVNTTIQGLINKNGSKYGWHEIEAHIVRSYLFECAKRCHYKEKRATKTAAKKETPPPLSIASASPSPLLSYKPLGERDSSLAPGPSPRPANRPPISTVFSDLTRPQSSNAGKAQPLESCTLYVTRVESGQTHEDTIDVFLKSASAKSSRGYGPNDYDFLIFKSELAENISYNEQTEVIRYWHSERGLLDVDNSSKWRVALRDLASRSSSGVLSFNIVQKDRTDGLRGLAIAAPAAESLSAVSETAQEGMQATKSSVPTVLVTSPTLPNQKAAPPPRLRFGDQNLILEQPESSTTRKTLIVRLPRHGLAAAQQQLASPGQKSSLNDRSKDDLAVDSHSLANQKRKALPNNPSTPSKLAGNSPWGPPKRSKHSLESTEQNEDSDDEDSEEPHPPRKRMRKKLDPKDDDPEYSPVVHERSILDDLDTEVVEYDVNNDLPDPETPRKEIIRELTHEECAQM
jgi:hypothetical protein